MKSVVICGSRRFKPEMREFAQKLKFLGVEVYEPHLHQAEDEWSGLSDAYKNFVALGLTHDHFYKIKMADAVFVFNKNGYSGCSTTLEIGYAVACGKPIYALAKDDELCRQILFREVVSSPEELAILLGYQNCNDYGKKRIVICGSMRFAQGMVDSKEKLEKVGFEVILPKNTELYLEGSEFLKQREASAWEPIEGAKRKIENNLIKGYYNEIAKSDAILVVNQEKDGIKNYIGGNTFLEMGFAHVLGKSIYCLNPLPEEQKNIYQELVALQVIVLNGNLEKIITPRVWEQKGE